MSLIYNIPGLHNSDEGHWQSYFERAKPDNFSRINQENWGQPDCLTWIDRIEQQLADQKYSEMILTGHSIGCMAILKWYEKYRHAIKGALLVAPSDSEKEDYQSYITGFTPIPMTRLPFPSIVVASTNDHVTDMARSELFATRWGSRLVVLENAGHIESSSGYGEWSQGLALVDELLQ